MSVRKLARVRSRSLIRKRRAEKIGPRRLSEKTMEFLRQNGMTVDQELRTTLLDAIEKCMLRNETDGSYGG